MIQVYPQNILSKVMHYSKVILANICYCKMEIDGNFQQEAIF